MSIPAANRLIDVPEDVILDNLAMCICCDEPDSEKYRAETRYWLEQLLTLRGPSGARRQK